jgi:hypothetical protein
MDFTQRVADGRQNPDPKGQRKRKWVDAKRAKKLLKHPEIGTLIDTLLVRFSERSSK